MKECSCADGAVDFDRPSELEVSRIFSKMQAQVSARLAVQSIDDNLHKQVGGRVRLHMAKKIYANPEWLLDADKLLDALLMDNHKRPLSHPDEQRIVYDYDNVHWRVSVRRPILKVLEAILDSALSARIAANWNLTKTAIASYWNLDRDNISEVSKWVEPEEGYWEKRFVLMLSYEHVRFDAYPLEYRITKTRKVHGLGISGFAVGNGHYAMYPVIVPYGYRADFGIEEAIEYIRNDAYFGRQEPIPGIN